MIFLFKKKKESKETFITSHLHISYVFTTLLNQMYKCKSVTTNAHTNAVIVVYKLLYSSISYKLFDHNITIVDIDWCAFHTYLQCFFCFFFHFIHLFLLF